MNSSANLEDPTGPLSDSTSFKSPPDNFHSNFFYDGATRYIKKNLQMSMGVVLFFIFPFVFCLILFIGLFYCFTISTVIFNDLARDRDSAYVVFMGRNHALLCCYISQRLLHGVGMYDAIMGMLVRQCYNVQSNPGEICFYGDSGFALWNGMTDAMKKHKILGFNVAFGGSTSSNCVAHFHSLCVARKPAMVALHVGGNDYDMGQKKEKIIFNLRLMQRAASFPVVFVLGPRKPAYTDAKWHFIRSIALQYSSTIDLSDLNLEYHADGMHATSASLSAIMAPRLARELRKFT